MVAARRHLQRLQFTTTGTDASQVDCLLGGVFADDQVVDHVERGNGVDRDIKRAAERGIVPECIQVTIVSAVFHRHCDRGRAALVG